MTILGYDNVALVGDSTISSVTLDINGVRVTGSGAITASVSVVNGYYQASIAGSYNTVTVSYAGQTLQVSNIALDVNSHFTTADAFLPTVLSGNDTVNGTSASELLTGYAGNDTLDGKAGSDSMVGGLGDDTYFVDNAGDVVTEANGEGLDAIKSTVAYTLAANIENLTLTGALAINGTGNAGDNLLTGNSAANTLDGGAGADTLVGGLGNDTYVVDNAGDIVTEISTLVTEIDTVQSSIGYTLGANIENLTLTGMADVAGTGNSFNNILIGNAGNNTLTSGGGNDSLDGGLGADTLIGGSGNDSYVVDDAGDIVIEASILATEIDAVKASIGYTLTVNVENLTLTGTADFDGTGNVLNNTVVGNDGNNYLDGGQGTDTLKGGRGNDTYIVDLIKSSAVAVLQDTVAENLNEGIDTLSLRAVDLGLVSATTLTLAANLENINLTATGSTKLNLTGNTVANVLTGNAADNILDGGLGADTLIGGAGNDTYIIDNTGDQITELDSEGTDLVKVNIATAGLTYTLGANIENGTLTNAVAYSLTGNGLDNLLTGNGLANTLTGGVGNDTLNGGAGADTLIGGADNDTYIVDNLLDIVTEQIGEGTDSVQSSVTHTLSDNVENLTLTGTLALNGTGNDGANTLTGNAGANILDGKGEADTLIGGLGNDTYVVDSVDDTVTETNALAAGGIDLVQSSVSWTLAPNVENLTLTGTGNIDGTGNGLANRITGNAGNNTLDGGAGIDALVGGAGNDTYLIDLTATGALQDTITEVAGGGADSLQLRGSATLAAPTMLTLAANLENLDASATGSTKLNLTGNTVANVLTGNAADNILDGGLGADTLIGGAGNDTYVVDNTSDTVTEALNKGTDTVNIKIATAGTHTLGNNIENGTLLNTVAYHLTGNALNNVLTGNAAANTLTGGDGNDTLNGGAGADTLIGGDGNDTYVIDNALDTVNEEANADNGDLIQSTLNIDLGLAKYTGIENLTLTGTAALNGTGNAGANILTGNGAANKLDGGLGADTLIGGAGNDTYLVDDANDTITELASGGTDIVKLTSTYAATSRTAETNVDNLDASAIGTGIALTGNELANILTGGAGNDTLDGGAGADTLKGGLGNDTYLVDLKTAGTGAAVASLQDTITEVAGATGGTDTLQLRGSAILTTASTLTLAADLENLNASGTGTTLLNLTGNASANVLTGNAAANVLNGGADNDTLIGGAGNDTLTGGSGADQFRFNTAPDAVSNFDRISDFTAAIDKFMLDSSVFGGLAPGALSSDAFASGTGLTAATTASQRVIYNLTTGMLYYDADGQPLSGVDTAPVVFAQITSGVKPALSAADFSIYSPA